MLINVVDKDVTNYYEYGILGMEYARDTSPFGQSSGLGFKGGEVIRTNMILTGAETVLHRPL